MVLGTRLCPPCRAFPAYIERDEDSNLYHLSDNRAALRPIPRIPLPRGRREDSSSGGHVVEAGAESFPSAALDLNQHAGMANGFLALYRLS